MLLRNNGVYALALVMLVALFALVKQRGRPSSVISFSVALSLGTAIFTYVLISGPIYSLAGITLGNSLQEMSSIPSQQFARTYLESPESFSQGEKEQLLAFYKQSDFADYKLFVSISDSQKGQLDTALVAQNPLEYLRLYLAIGIKQPQIYCEAFLLNSLGFFYPNKQYPDERIYHPYIEYQMLDAKLRHQDYTVIARQSMIPKADAVFEEVAQKALYSKIPVLSFVFKAGTYLIFYLIVAAYAFCTRHSAFALPFALIFGLFLTLLLSPVCIFRYVYPFISCFPLVLALLVLMIREARKRNNKST